MKSSLTSVRFLLLRIFLLVGLSLLTFYVFYRVTFINFSPGLVVFSLILFIAELHTIFHLYGMFYSLWPRPYPKFDRPYINRKMRFNIFICVCGEPVEIVRETVRAAQRAADRYIEVVNPLHPPRVVVLNDGRVAKKDNWYEIEVMSEQEEADHIARTIPGGFKAGNLNNGFQAISTDDPFNTLDVVFDSDFAAKDEFLLEMVRPFEDKTVDFAQSPQRYKNEKTWVAKAAAAHQIFFFDYICAAKGWDNALFLCGTNFAVRRSAFDAIGGMDTKYITEDYATSLELHLNGFRGVFISKVLAEGVAPASLKQYFSQQQRWSKGSMDVSRAYLGRILFGPLTAKQKFHYLLSATYYLIGMRDLILMLAPLPYLFFGVSLVTANTWQYLIFIYAPLLVYNFILYLVLFRHPIKSLVLDISAFPVFVSAFLSSALKKDLSFIVTIKKYERENPFTVYKVQLLIAAILFAGLLFAFGHRASQGGSVLNYFWASFDVTVLALGFYLIVRENYNTAWIEKVLGKIASFAFLVVKSPVVTLPRVGYMLFLVVVAVFLATQTVPANSFGEDLVIKQNQTVAKQELLIPQDGIYFGYYLPQLNAHPVDPIPKSVANEKSSLLMYYQDWSPESKFDSAFLNRISGSGHVPVVTWEPWVSNRPEKTGYKPQDIVNGSQDKFIRNWAKEAAAYRKPFYLRFAHEMNGNWYQWGDQNGSTAYIAMWKYVHDIFEQEGANNVIWLWSPNNTDEFGSTDSILSYYPGDNYVDWVGFSGFNWGTSSRVSHWSSFKDIAYGAYEKLSTINKPIMVAETSSVSTGGNKQAWFDQTLMRDLPELPRIKAVILFDQNFNNSDFSLTSGQDFGVVIQNNIVNNGYYIKDPIYKTVTQTK
jgi:cellulose synthase/poly-beta-1,6-N-acetylglucosamine synthase-like glycosyltransferase